MIEVKHLTKQYGDKLAVNDISFTVEDGEILGLLGPNHEYADRLHQFHLRTGTDQRH